MPGITPLTPPLGSSISPFLLGINSEGSLEGSGNDEVLRVSVNLNKDNEKVYYPLINRGLRAIWSYDQINKIKSCYLKYLKS